MKHLISIEDLSTVELEKLFHRTNNLKNPDNEFSKEITLLDVVPLSIGVESDNGLMIKNLISKKLLNSVQSVERKEHSEKPEEFREIIDTLYTHGKKIELFSRKQTEGWDVWGNQV